MASNLLVPDFNTVLQSPMETNTPPVARACDRNELSNPLPLHEDVNHPQTVTVPMMHKRACITFKLFVSSLNKAPLQSRELLFYLSCLSRLQQIQFSFQKKPDLLQHEDEKFAITVRDFTNTALRNKTCSQSHSASQKERYRRHTALNQCLSHETITIYAKCHVLQSSHQTTLRKTLKTNSNIESIQEQLFQRKAADTEHVIVPG